MGPKKGKGKKGKGKPDPGWQKTITWGTWSRPYESMPNPAVKAAFGQIRVDFLAAVKELDMIWSKTMTEEFLDELFGIPRPNLEFLCIRGAYLLKRFILSPYDLLTGLKRLDIGCMDELQFVMIQCNRLEWLSLARSKSLTKALVEAPNLQELVIDHCLKLACLVVCSKQMSSITGLDDAIKLEVLYLDCPTLVDFTPPPLYVVPKPVVVHPTLLQIRSWEDDQEPIRDVEHGLLPKDLVVDDDPLQDDKVYPNIPRFPRTHLQGF